MAGGDCPGSRRADIGQVAVVEENRLDDPGLGAEEDHETIEAGQAELGIVEETGADLDREAVEPRHISGLHVDFAMPFGNRHRQDRRHHHAAGREVLRRRGR